MKKTSKKWFLVLLIPLTALFFAKVDTQYKYVGTAGDLTAIVNPINTLTSNSFAFRPNINNGYIDTAASLLGLNSPYVLYESALFKLD